MKKINRRNIIIPKCGKLKNSYPTRQSSNKIQPKFIQVPMFQIKQENIVKFPSSIPSYPSLCRLSILGITCIIICSRVTNHTIIAKHKQKG